MSGIRGCLSGSTTERAAETIRASVTIGNLMPSMCTLSLILIIPCLSIIPRMTYGSVRSNFSEEFPNHFPSTDAIKHAYPLVSDLDTKFIRDLGISAWSWCGHMHTEFEVWKDRFLITPSSPFSGLFHHDVSKFITRSLFGTAGSTCLDSSGTAVSDQPSKVSVIKLRWVLPRGPSYIRRDPSPFSVGSEGTYSPSVFSGP